MPSFSPTSPIAGRLVRLSVVLSTGIGRSRLEQLTTLCDRGGMDAVCLRDESEGRASPVAVAKGLASRLRRASIGVTIDVSDRSVEDVVDIGRAVVGHDHFELGLATAQTRPTTPPSALRPYLEALVESWPGRTRPRLSVVLDEGAHLAAGVALADDLVLPVTANRDVRSAIEEIHQACRDAGRPQETLGVALEAPVSIGRTHAEAVARAERDPRFSVAAAASPVGIVGRLEDCQERVIELAHLGVTDLRCILPVARDIHDAIAQLNSMVVGSRDVLMPGSPRSKDPEPPPGWGGPPRSA